ncbi:MAG: hypothetical protein SGJ20_19130 [Planctomycetota bacterium]|nr:hypothetical protein [Planctomycetota bacterium]
MNEQLLQTVRKERPYPRPCALCGKLALHGVVIPYDVKIKHDGKLHEFHIPALPSDQCSECQQIYFTNATADAKNNALRDHIGLLHPAQIKEFLTKHNLTQRSFASHLRVAEESVSRWVNGESIQSRALDTLMRVYFAKPDVREMLASGSFISITPNETAGPSSMVST